MLLFRDIRRAIVNKPIEPFRNTRFVEVWLGGSDCYKLVIDWIEFAKSDPSISISGEAPYKKHIDTHTQDEITIKESSGGKLLKTYLNLMIAGP